eukprot:CCRYP_015353-RB/>CCRYP_015353-RB protein AED:0.48 eAED:0.49 QI:0/0/0/1/0/0/2/0/117
MTVRIVDGRAVPSSSTSIVLIDPSTPSFPLAETGGRMRKKTERRLSSIAFEMSVMLDAVPSSDFNGMFALGGASGGRLVEGWPPGLDVVALAAFKRRFASSFSSNNLLRFLTETPLE